MEDAKRAALASAKPSPRWGTCKAGAALLVFILLVGTRLAGQASVGTVAGAVRHWVLYSVSLPARATPVGKTVPPAASRSATSPGAGGGKPSGPASRWGPVAPGARVSLGFGWHGNGAAAKFSPGVSLLAPLGTAVTAGVTGTVTQTVRQPPGWIVVVRVSANTSVWYGDLGQTLVHKGQRVGRDSNLGRFRTSAMRLEVKAHGFPVDPLGTRYFGSGWVRRAGRR
ncbi:MAG: M23 family metallopeptidase [Thermaerobacter sp.]|nr:M23 family metallopeptidase [Thermaerobacter sp.]